MFATFIFLGSFMQVKPTISRAERERERKGERGKRRKRERERGVRIH
jgi:hypothetical protein